MGGINVYAYAVNNPLSLLDPLGLYSWAEFKADAAFFKRNSGEGLAAFADGANPFGDPLANRGVYDPCDSTLRPSYLAGEVTAAAEAALATHGIVNGFGDIRGAPNTEDIPSGSYDQPDGGRTDIRQQEDHGAGVTHTHDPVVNTNPQTGESFVNGLQKPGRPVSHRDVRNIRSGAAPRSKPRGR